MHHLQTQILVLSYTPAYVDESYFVLNELDIQVLLLLKA